jgi:hypothetical protein
LTINVFCGGIIGETREDHIAIQQLEKILGGMDVGKLLFDRWIFPLRAIPHGRRREPVLGGVADQVGEDGGS